MKKSLKIFISSLLGIVLWTLVASMSFAYFDRGDVTISSGSSSVNLEQGDSKTISVKVSPSKDEQLPGCGMAECPQVCGEKECLNADGECTCNGTTYQTYYANVTTSSSNTSVAIAEYSNGNVIIKAIDSGSAKITLTASLRQYTSTSTTINVTVAEKEAVKETTKKETSKQETTVARETTKQETTIAKETTKKETSAKETTKRKTTTKETTKQETTIAKETTKKEISVKETTSTSAIIASKVEESVVKESSVKESSTEESSVKESTTVESSTAESETQEETTVLESSIEQEKEETVLESSSQESIQEQETILSDRGKIYFVPISDGKMGKENLEVIQGKEEYVDFQNLDESGSVVYAWEFFGKDITNPFDLDLNIYLSNEPFENWNSKASGKEVYLTFGHEGELPATATIYLKVSEWFSDEDCVNLYQYKGQNDIVKISEGLAVTNGYVEFQLDHCSQYVLSTQVYENNTQSTSIWIFIAIGVMAILVVLGVLVYRKKKA